MVRSTDLLVARRHARAGAMRADLHEAADLLLRDRGEVGQREAVRPERLEDLPERERARDARRGRGERVTFCHTVARG